MPNEFTHDVFVSHSAKEKAVVRPFDSLSASAGERARARCRNLHLAERLPVAVRQHLKVWFDEWLLKPGDSIPARTEEGLGQSRVLACPGEARWRRRMLCMSANAFGSDWVDGLTGSQLATANSQSTGAPLNRARRFIPLRLAARRHRLHTRCPGAHRRKQLCQLNSSK